MTVAELKKKLMTMPNHALVVLAVQVSTGDEQDEDHFTIDELAENVMLRPDLKVQIGDRFN
jgi:hypothetical protein